MPAARGVSNAEHCLGALLALSGFVVNSAGLLAQTGQSGAGELTGYTGVTFASIDAHPAVGASSGLTLSRHSAALLDLCYMPLGSATLQSYPGRTLVRNSGLYDLSLNAHIRIPLGEKWEPYGIIGGAVLFSTYQLASRARPGEVAYAGRSDTDLGFETGGGLRYFVRDNWGVRTELRYTVSHRSFGRMLAGVFYQFDREWDFRPRHYSGRSRHH